MKVYLIRHSEPTYSTVTAAGYVGYGRDLAGLSERGIAIAKETSHNPIFQKIELMLASPYTRALQTAHYLAKPYDFDLKVELGLLEWRPDLSGRRLTSEAQSFAAFREYCRDKTHRNPGYPLEYETGEEVKARMLQVLAKYQEDYSRIACVTHGEAMRQFVGEKKIAYCGIEMVDI